MDAVTTYITGLLALLVVVVVAAVLFFLGRRMKQEQTFVGFTRPKDEVYAGYTLLSLGLLFIVICVFELILVLTGGPNNAPFGLSNLNLLGISGSIWGSVLGIDFWLTIILLVGRPLAARGLDLLKGKKVVVKVK